MEEGLTELRDEVLGTDACMGCGSCVNLCPNVISIEDRIAVIGDCQISSGRCYRYCPRTTPAPHIADLLCGDVGYGGPVGVYRDYCMSRSTLSEQRHFSQYGGTVTALLIQAIREGVINHAVVTKAAENFPYPISVQGEEQIISAGGSKFALSPTNKEVNRSSIAPDTKIGVVALPCQATGLRKKQLQPRDDGIAEGNVAFVIGLFCTWAVGQTGWRLLLRKHVGSQSITGMDIPPPPANILVLDVTSGRIVIPLEEVNEHVRPGCTVCLDMTAENADISVGMVEGKAGWNTVMIRSEQGARVFKAALESGLIQRRSLDPASWKHLEEASVNKKRRALMEAEKRSQQLPYYQRILKLKDKIMTKEDKGNEW
jgi:coenzyme F420 hydrogenase subunit beta